MVKLYEHIIQFNHISVIEPISVVNSTHFYTSTYFLCLTLIKYFNTLKLLKIKIINKELCIYLRFMILLSSKTQNLFCDNIIY